MSNNTLGHRIKPAVQTVLTATGSSQASAFRLTNSTCHEFTTVPVATGAILPVGITPSEISIFNDGANSLSIYPPMGGSIDAGAANASIALAPGSGATFWASTPSNWYHLVTGSSSVVTPGGSSGQIQYDNAGTFGGFTASGDATINTSTGIVTVTKTSGTSFAPSATTDTTNANNITSGTLPAAVLPNPSASTLGGVQSAAAVAHQWINSISTTGVPALSQPAFSDISGTLPAAVLPNPSASTLGGVESAAAVAHQWINSISTTGVPALSQPAFSDISGAATLAQFPTIASHTTLANTTGGTAVPAGVTLSALIDAAIDNTQGDLLYRGASAWSNLAPAASAGAILYSGGSAANPAWTTNILRGTDGNLSFSAISHSSVTAGDLWYPSSDQGTFIIGRAGNMKTRLGGCIFSCGACAAVANSNSATSIFGTPTGSKGTLTIPANVFAANNLLRWYIAGVFSCTGSTPTVQIDYILNGSTILSGVGGTASLAAAGTNKLAQSSQAYLLIQSIGASATANGQGQVLFYTTGGQNVQAVPGGLSAPVPTSTFDSTSNALFDIKLTWGTASPTNSFAVQSFALFLDN